MPCTVTGDMVFVTGAVVPLTQFQFRRTNVVGQDDLVVLPDPVYATTDTDGILTVELFAGQYVAEYSRPNAGRVSFAVGVPDAASADLHDLIDQNPTITPTLLSNAIAARDAAIAARDIAQTAAASVGYTILEINDDSVGSIVPPEPGGFALITYLRTAPTYLFPDPDHGKFFYYDTGSSLNVLNMSTVVGASADIVTTDVTGTSGTDGRTTIAARPGLIKIENRSGSEAGYKVSFR